MARADEALMRSGDGLIMVDTPRGLVTIYREGGDKSDTAKAFHVRFVPRDAHGHLNAAGTVVFGSYDDLDTALTIAAVSYGVTETGWILTSEEQLARAAPVEHAPDIDGRRISPHE